MRRPGRSSRGTSSSRCASSCERTDLRLGTVIGAEPDRRCVRVRSLDGREDELRYDQLVVALGSVSRTLPVPGLAEHGMGFKTLPEAIALRNRVLGCLEAAETLDDPAEREAWLTFVFVGAGYAGLEGAAELQDFAADVLDLYPRCRTQGVRFMLVEARDRVMAEIQPSLADFAARRAARARDGHPHRHDARGGHGARARGCPTARRCPRAHVVWTAGVKPHPVVARLGLPLDDGGRIVVDRFMQVQGREDVWAIGDAAAVPDPAQRGRAASPPTAQHAIRQGRRVAGNVAAALGSGRRRPFRYRTLGVFVDMGRHQAVAEHARDPLARRRRRGGWRAATTWR